MSAEDSAANDSHIEKRRSKRYIVWCEGRERQKTVWTGKIIDSLPMGFGKIILMSVEIYTFSHSYNVDFLIVCRCVRRVFRQRV